MQTNTTEVNAKFPAKVVNEQVSTGQVDLEEYLATPEEPTSDLPTVANRTIDAITNDVPASIQKIDAGIQVEGSGLETRELHLVDAEVQLMPHRR